MPEISRSGDGAHVWFFFDAPVAAVSARRLATALIERTCREEKLVSLSSHDRFIPNQDVVTGAGFGSLVALPLQKSARERGASVFVDDDLVPFADPWQALEDTLLIGAKGLSTLIDRVEDGHGGAALDSMEDIATPWRRSNGGGDNASISKLDLPSHLSITRADGVYIERMNLPQPLLYSIARLAAFSNPHWHELERVHRSTWNIARFVDKSRLLARRVRLPRGCWDAVLDLLGLYSIELQVQDERNLGNSLDLRFMGELKPAQKTALHALLASDTGVLHAPPGFGKTVTAAAVISQRRCSTLVIVHTTDLLRQWQSRLAEFLSVEIKDIGTIGGGRKRKLTGKLDIAGVRSLAKLDDDALDDVLGKYGQIIVDECHHAGAASHTRVLEAAHVRYVLGLTATPTRRDGLEPVVFMNCGPVRHRVSETDRKSIDRVLERLEWPGVPDAPAEGLIQEVLSAVAGDVERTTMIATAVVDSWRQGRKVLVLTERRGHIVTLVDQIREIAGDSLLVPFVLHGKLTSRVRRETVAKLDALDEDQPRCLVATGKLIGEGFDHPPLDTVVFAMPFAWRGTLQQYLGRLARASKGKRDIRVIDVHDTGHPMLESMWRKRQKGYRALGWRSATKGQLF
ncbi:MAG: DEAD/DEAH box helicase family protein [Granulosicoccaceae bacterium]